MYRSLIAVNCSYGNRGTVSFTSCQSSSSNLCVWLYSLFQLCPGFLAYTVVHRPRLAAGGTQTEEHKVTVGSWWRGEKRILRRRRSDLSVGVFYCGVVLLNKNALNKLDCLERTKYVEKIREKKKKTIKNPSGNIYIYMYIKTPHICEYNIFTCVKTYTHEYKEPIKHATKHL